VRRYLCLSGGGAKGRVQTHCIRQLLARHSYDGILGVSIGACNGALAAQGDLHVMDELWEIDDPNPVDGLTGFLAPAVHRWRGVYSLDPLARKFATLLDARRLKVPFHAGVTVKETREYRDLVFDASSASERFRAGVLGSSAIAGLMEAWPYKLDGKIVDLADGGHRHVLPPAPEDATHIDAVFCSRIDPMTVKRTEVDGLLESMMWLVETAFEQTQEADVDDLRRRARAGVEVTVYAPSRPHGGLLAASAEVMANRAKIGVEMYSHPVRL